eukprot:5576138-Amphidinium_carterae.1
MSNRCLEWGRCVSYSAATAAVCGSGKVAREYRVCRGFTLCEVMKLYWRERGLKAVEACAHRALRIQHSADSTPVKTKMSNTIGSGLHRTKTVAN